MSLNHLVKKLNSYFPLTEKISVTHFLYIWFLSVFGFLTVYVVVTDFFTKEINETAFGNSTLFSLLFYGLLVLGFGAFCFASLLILLNALNNKKLGKAVRLIILASLLSIASYSFYKIGFQEGKRSVVFEVTRDDAKRYCDMLEDNGPILPACQIDGISECPTYELWNGQSIVRQPMGMNRGLAEIWIIKDDKVVYKSGVEYGLTYRVNEDGSGITLRYIKEYDETGIIPKIVEEKRLIYSGEDGEWGVGGVTNLQPPK